MLNPRWVNLYGYAFLVIVLAMIALILLNVIPQSMRIPLFLVALVLYLIRVTMRLMLDRQRRLQEKKKEEQGADSAKAKGEK